MDKNEQRRLEDRLRSQRPTLDLLALDIAKRRAMIRAPRREISMRARLTAAVAVAMLVATTGGAVALIGPSNLFTGQNAAEVQYGQNGPPGQNGQNGAPGANGQNGAPGTNIVTITIQNTAPLPGSAKPTETKHTRIRVCKRYPHHSAKFHRTFHPRTCWYRFI